jgi:hypothetical protein
VVLILVVDPMFFRSICSLKYTLAFSYLSIFSVATPLSSVVVSDLEIISAVIARNDCVCSESSKVIHFCADKPC